MIHQLDDIVLHSSSSNSFSSSLRFSLKAGREKGIAKREVFPITTEVVFALLLEVLDSWLELGSESRSFFNAGFAENISEMFLCRLALVAVCYFDELTRVYDASEGHTIAFFAADATVVAVEVVSIVVGESSAVGGSEEAISVFSIAALKLQLLVG